MRLLLIMSLVSQLGKKRIKISGQYSQHASDPCVRRPAIHPCMYNPSLRKWLWSLPADRFLSRHLLVNRHLPIRVRNLKCWNSLDADWMTDHKSPSSSALLPLSADEPGNGDEQGKSQYYKEPNTYPDCSRSLFMRRMRDSRFDA